MKKTVLIALTFCFISLMSACGSNTIENAKMTINRAELTEEEQNILDLVNVGEKPYLWDFILDDSVKSMTILTYELIDSDWNQVAYSSEQFEDLEGRIALVFDNIADGVTIGVDSESKSGSQSYRPDHDINFEGMASTTSTLSNPYDIVYEEEVPLVIQIHTTSDEIRSTNPEYGFFEDIDNYVNYEKVYAITVMFSQNTVAELDEVKIKDYEEENLINVQAKIVDQRDDSYLIVGEDENLQGLINVHIEDTDIPNVIKVGDFISFDFDGMVAESYPAQISNLSNIQLVEEKGDTIGVYREALLELRGKDSGLDENANEIVLDLTEVNNLSSVEKEALTYLFACDIDKFDSVYQSSMSELMENAKITDEDGFLSIPEGVVYKISNVEESYGFTFDIEKWASSLGAYGFSDCKATFKNNSYTWEKGDEWIS